MSTRGRPKKYRYVHHDPRISQFSPRGRPGRPDEVYLSVDELEALYMADFMGHSQKQAAESMHISQQTFSRVMKRARRTIADGIITGKIIKIQGGSYVIDHRDNPAQISPEIPSNQPAKAAKKNPK